MAMNEPFDWRRSDRRLYAIVATLFPIVVLIGFARTYYLKFAFGDLPLPSLLVHIHGVLMSAWVLFFVAQVWLIRSKNQRIHMKAGMFGVVLAIAMIVVGSLTAIAAAKHGSASTPPGVSPLGFLAVPVFDLLMFAGLFGAAIFYRKRPANHKRLMLLTVINFLPPAIGRFPFPSLMALGPLFFLGVPALITIGLLVYDTWRNKKLNLAFLVGGVTLIASYPIRMILMGTPEWMSFATWLTGFVP
jgi:hypothetical protein